MNINNCNKCGSVAELTEEPGMIDIVKCSNDDCGHESSAFYDGALQAATQWNEANVRHEALIDLAGRFDFEKVHAYMTLVNWTWHSKAVPSVYELKQTAKHLLNHLLNDKESSCYASGGFEARRSGSHISLSFHIDSVEFDNSGSVADKSSGL